MRGIKKKILQDVVSYYVNTTGESYDSFIINIQRGVDDKNYPSWLAYKCLELLNSYGITLEDCINNKDILHFSVLESKGRREGEFYTPEVWCQEARKYLKEMLGDLWGKAYIWDASCGTGNLLKTANYPPDKVFMSTLLAEDIEIVKNILPDVTAFQLDFLKGGLEFPFFDFLDYLPEKLIKVLENNEPIVFFMNPPYKVVELGSNDVSAVMLKKVATDYMDGGVVSFDNLASTKSLASAANDLYYHFWFRMIQIKRHFNLTNMYLGIFGPLTLFHSRVPEPLYEVIKNHFQFQSGMVFSAKDFTNTSDSVGWSVCFTTWKTKKEGDEDRKLLVDTKMLNEKGEVVKIGEKLISNVDVLLEDWVQPKDSVRFEMVPSFTNIENLTGKWEKFTIGALGSMMSSMYAERGTRRACLMSLPCVDGVDITQENFWRCVASFAARRSYCLYKNPFDNCQYFSKPDETIEGYEDWLADGLVLFIFDMASYQASIRGLEFEGTIINRNNRLFPLSQEEVREIIVDDVLIEDMKRFPAQNQFLLAQIEKVRHRFSPEAKELFDFGIQLLKNSLQGYKRREFNYALWTSAWDAGLAQLRYIDGFLTKEEFDHHKYLVKQLRSKLLSGVYKYGFLMDTRGLLR